MTREPEVSGIYLGGNAEVIRNPYHSLPANSVQDSISGFHVGFGSVSFLLEFPGALQRARLPNSPHKHFRTPRDNRQLHFWVEGLRAVQSRDFGFCRLHFAPLTMIIHGI